MHRNNLLSLLQNYAPLDKKELDKKKQLLSFIAENPECFERSLPTGHITGSAWLINKANTHALLLHHAKLNLWCQPGGHCDGESDVLAVALKEAKEESGIEAITPFSTEIFDVDIHEIPPYKGIPRHLHYDIRFLLQVTSQEEALGNLESTALLWIGKEEKDLPSQEESILRMHYKWKNLLI